jgi:hypothetical protein
MAVIVSSILSFPVVMLCSFFTALAFSVNLEDSISLCSTESCAYSSVGSSIPLVDAFEFNTARFVAHLRPYGSGHEEPDITGFLHAHEIPSFMPGLPSSITSGTVDFRRDGSVIAARFLTTHGSEMVHIGQGNFDMIKLVADSTVQESSVVHGVDVLAFVFETESGTGAYAQAFFVLDDLPYDVLVFSHELHEAKGRLAQIVHDLISDKPNFSVLRSVRARASSMN